MTVEGEALTISFIGARAVISNAALLTRGAGRYRTYFPGIAPIAPN